MKTKYYIILALFKSLQYVTLLFIIKHFIENIDSTDFVTFEIIGIIGVAVMFYMITVTQTETFIKKYNLFKDNGKSY